MNNYRFILEPYSGPQSRYDCPGCGKSRQFTRYLDTQTMEHIASNVGLCNRRNNCGYHYTPKQYFSDTKSLMGCHPSNLSSASIHTSLKPVLKPNSVSTIPVEIFKNSLHSYDGNFFIEYLFSLFEKDITSSLINNYFIGNSNHWSGANVFWQIDTHGRVKAGKIMLYNPNTGHRVKEPYPHVSWVHTALHLQGFSIQQCFFGEHLLNRYKTKPVAIVESEKTAILASVYLPQFLWLACGSLNGLNIEKFKVLIGRRVFLFPDIGGYDMWKDKSLEIGKSLTTTITVSNYLEIECNNINKEKGHDLADFLIKRDDKFGWALSSHNYPQFWDF
jgi:Domain of unknown function (DUF6371)